MREIKFRAKTLEGRVIYFNLHNSHLSGDDDVFYVCGIPCSVGSEQLFTGYRDKAGTEIYEGDIIRYNYHLKEPDTDFVMEVVYDIREMKSDEDSFFNVGFIIRALEQGEYWYTDMPDLPDTQVIGNIYENPELMNLSP